MTHPQQNQILDQRQIQQKITRIAYEIYEHNFEEKELVLAGIYENGYILAQMLATELQHISSLSVLLLQVNIDKTAPATTPVALTPATIALADKVVILIDDVLNTGRILAHALPVFLQHVPRKVEIATLVDRRHTLFPVAATYTGYSLATTLREHIQVVLQPGEVAAYLV